jgi:hypothetical protein
MDRFLVKIQEMFEKQNIFIEKQFNKLSKRITNLKSRVTSLEKDKRNRTAPKKIKTFDCFENPKTRQLQSKLKNFDYTKARLITSGCSDSRKNPQLFQNFIKHQFSDDKTCNIYLKGVRMYVFENNDWQLVDKPGEIMKSCLKNLWGSFNETCKDELCDTDGWDSFFKQPIEENERLGAPITITTFKDYIRKHGKKH